MSPIQSAALYLCSPARGKTKAETTHETLYRKEIKMNKHPNYRQFIFAMIGILVLVMSLANSGGALAAQTTADLSITMVPDKTRVKIGQNIVYIVTVTNNGPDAALFVGVFHGLADQLNFVSLACGQGVSASGSFCEYPSLDPGETVVSIFIATPNPSVQKHERNALTATAVVSSQIADSIDPDSGNNLASVTIRLIGKPK
jgi:uncharacterized repeat protein (TIGR01451 family)